MIALRTVIVAIVATVGLMGCQAPSGPEDGPMDNTTADIRPVEVSPQQDTLAVGATTEVEAVSRDEQGQPVAAQFTWRSLDEAIVEVEANTVSGTSRSTATLRARAGGAAGVVVEANGAADTLVVLAGQSSDTASP